jgi:branched-chain amino acid transport system substrate-binding protein
VVEALRRVGGDPTCEKLLSAINAAPFDLGGVVLSYGADKNQGSDHAFFTIMQADGSFKRLVRLIKMAGQWRSARTRGEEIVGCVQVNTN